MNGGVVSSSHVSAAPSSSEGGLFILFPDPSWGPSLGDSPAWTSLLWVLPVGYSSTLTTPVWVPSTESFRNRLLQSESPTGSTDCFNAGYPQGHSLLWATTCSAWGHPQAGSQFKILFTVHSNFKNCFDFSSSCNIPHSLNLNEVT